MELLLEHLRNQLQKPLPGENAHATMAPYRKAGSVEAAKDKKPIPSAVMVLLFPENGRIKIALIKRNEYNGTHSAQISFPGGKKDQQDRSLLETAIRETKEEIGVEINENDILGELTPLYIPPSNFMVTPFIAVKKTKPDFIPDIKEVSYIVIFPIELLKENSIVKETMVTVGSGMLLNVPYYDIEGEIVWGATAAILSELKEMLRSSTY